MNNVIIRRRTFERRIPEDAHSPSIVELVFLLPPFLSKAYIQRHNLSMNDMGRILDNYPAEFVWYEALLNGIGVSASALKPSFLKLDNVLMSSKAIATKKLWKTYNHSFNSVDMLNIQASSSLDHFPPLPTHPISLSQMEHLHSIICSTLDIFNVNVVPGLFQWNNMLWLPCGMEDTSIFCKSVCEFEVYEAAIREVFSNPEKEKPLSTRGLVVLCQEKRYIARDECVLFSCVAQE
jgi:hypothetical protein